MAEQKGSTLIICTIITTLGTIIASYIAIQKDSQLTVAKDKIVDTKADYGTLKSSYDQLVEQNKELKQQLSEKGNSVGTSTPSVEPIPSSGTRIIKVSYQERDAVHIDQKNYLAVTNPYDTTTVDQTIQCKMTGFPDTNIRIGFERTFKGANNEECTIVYMGLKNKYFIFEVRCDTK